MRLSRPQQRRAPTSDVVVHQNHATASTLVADWHHKLRADKISHASARTHTQISREAHPPPLSPPMPGLSEVSLSGLTKPRAPSDPASALVGPIALSGVLVVTNLLQSTRARNIRRCDRDFRKRFDSSPFSHIAPSSPPPNTKIIFIKRVCVFVCEGQRYRTTMVVMEGSGKFR